MKPLFFAAPLALVILSMTPAPAFACRCGVELTPEKVAEILGIVPVSAPRPQPTPQQWLDGFDGAVFLGEVINEQAVKKGADEEEVKYTFRVLRQWKGVQGPEIVVSTTRYGTTCDISFDPKRTHRIIADRTSKGWETHFCTEFFFPWTDAEFRRTLGEGSPPPTR